MKQERPSSLNTSLLCFLAGAVAGAVVVALTTPKKGAELRGDLSALGRRAKRQAAALAQQVKDARNAAFHGQSGPGNRAADAWADLQQGASQVASDVKQTRHDVAMDLGS